VLTTLLSGAGFSSSSGLNATLPLLVLALVDRVSSTIDLDGPYDFISGNVGILLLLLVLPIELVADKIPKLDHFSNLAHSAIRPLVGAFCFMALASAEDSLNVWAAAILGFAIATAVHMWKVRERPRVTTATRGLGNPFISVLEDVIAIVVSIVSAFAPVANVALIPAAAWLLYRSAGRMIRGESQLIGMFMPRPRA